MLLPRLAAVPAGTLGAFSLSMLLIMLLIASMVTSYSQQTLWREIVARNTTQVDAAA